MGSAFSSLLGMDAAKAIPLVAQFLDDPEETAAEAAFALAATHTPEALTALISRRRKGADGWFAGALDNAIPREGRGHRIGQRAPGVGLPRILPRVNLPIQLRNSAIAETTVSCSSGRISGKIGSASTSFAARSASGKLPSA